MTFQPGHKRIGGRKKGTPNKTTVARAAAVQANERALGRKLGIERMAEAMDYLFAMSARYQVGGQTPDEAKCIKYLKMGADIAADITRYQTPPLANTTLRAETPLHDGKPIRVELKLV